MSEFSDFIRHATPDERREVFERVMADANVAQSRELLQATEACAKHHQERADSLLAENKKLKGDLHGHDLDECPLCFIEDENERLLAENKMLRDSLSHRAYARSWRKFRNAYLALAKR